MKRIVLLLFLAAPFLQSASQNRRDVVEEFCRLDLSGARLHSTADAPIWRLTLDDGEPLDSPVVIARGFHRASAVDETKSDTVTIHYDVLGLVDDDLSFKPGSTRFATGNFQLRWQNSWKISLKSLKVPPHVSPAAYVQHIDLLIQAMNRKPPQQRDQSRLAFLEKLKTQILALK